MKFKVAGFGLVLIAVVLMMSGCAQVIVSSSGTQPTPVIEEITAEPQDKVDASALPCPQDVPGMQLVSDETHGFCTLIPEGFSVEHPNDYEVVFIGPVPEWGTHALAIIVVRDAEGKAAAEHAAPLVAEAEGMGMAVTQTRVTIGGEEGLVVDGLPGQDINRRVFVVHGEQLYDILFVTAIMPDDPGYEPTHALYDAVTGSFAFLP